MNPAAILSLISLAVDVAAKLSSTALQVAAVLQENPDLTEEQRQQLIDIVHGKSGRLAELAK